MSATNTPHLLYRRASSVPLLTLLFWATAVSAFDIPAKSSAGTGPSPLIAKDQNRKAVQRPYGGPDAALMAAQRYPSSIHVDALPQTTGISEQAIDLEQIAKGYQAITEAPAGQTLASKAHLWIFISLSMPEASLKHLIAQSERSGAVLVLRGFQDHSLRRTFIRIRQLLGKRRATIQIDPRLYDQFGIKVVPTFVLQRSNAITENCSSNHCDRSDAFVITSGDVSLDYALTHMVQQAPSFSASANNYLKRMGK